MVEFLNTEIKLPYLEVLLAWERINILLLTHSMIWGNSWYSWLSQALVKSSQKKGLIRPKKVSHRVFKCWAGIDDDCFQHVAKNVECPLVLSMALLVLDHVLMYIKVCLTLGKNYNINFIKGHLEDIENIGFVFVLFPFSWVQLSCISRPSLSWDKKERKQP